MTEKPQPAPQYIKAESVEPADAAGTQTSAPSSTTNTEALGFPRSYLFTVANPDNDVLMVDSWLDVSLLVRGDLRTKRDTVNALKGNARDLEVEVVVQKAVQMYLRAQGQRNLIGPLMIQSLTSVEPYEVSEYLLTQPEQERQRFFRNAAVPIALLGLQL